MGTKVIRYGPNERLVIKNSPRQTDIYLSRKGYDKHDHIWIDKERRTIGARLDRSFKREPNSHTGCFLTTACVEYAGLPDNCAELETMRWFRDNFVRGLPEGDSLLTEYYAVAPLIVERIKSRPDAPEVFEQLLGSIRTAARLIESRQLPDALRICLTEFERLKEEYL